jgi:Family of unknown function (DUF6062)
MNPKKHILSEKFTTYFDILDSCKLKGCPVCSLSTQNLRKYFDNLLYENVNDPGVRKALRLSFGFCAVHTKMLSDVGDALGISIVYTDIIQHVRMEMEQGNLQALNDPAPCPACDIKGRRENELCGTIADHLADDKLRHSLQESSGLCLVHLARVTEYVQDVETQRWLRKLHAEKLETLRTRMREFIRKNELRFSHETITESEHESCADAIDTLVGMNI